MGELAGDLKEMGYERTEKESPFHDNGTLWTKGYEIVCDETAIVIRGGGKSFLSQQNNSGKVYTYRNSGKVKLPGGYTGSYHWGDRDGRFRY